MSKNFTDGLIFKKPRENAPEFIKGSLSVKVDDFIEYLKKNESNGWVNIDLKVSKEGKYYAELNDWKPNTQDNEPKVENIPF